MKVYIVGYEMTGRVVDSRIDSVFASLKDAKEYVATKQKTTKKKKWGIKTKELIK
jgi:hypothetical protein